MGPELSGDRPAPWASRRCPVRRSRSGSSPVTQRTSSRPSSMSPRPSRTTAPSGRTFSRRRWRAPSPSRPSRDRSRSPRESSAPVGGRIVAETFVGLLLADSSSYVNLYPDWRPTKPTQHGVFGLREMIASGICLERAGTESAEQPVAAEQHVLCRHDTGDRRSETHPPLSRGIGAARNRRQITLSPSLRCTIRAAGYAVCARPFSTSSRALPASPGCPPWRSSSCTRRRPRWPW